MPAKKLTCKTHPARIVPSMLDQLEAMVRHPAFRRSLLLWRTIFSKNYAGLTEDEERERDAPRTKFRIAAIMEADAHWLSQSIRDIRQRGEAMWAVEAVNGPWGDRTDTVNLHIPGDLSLDAIERCVGQVVRQERKASGIRPIQHPRRPEVDPWTVYDLKHNEGLSLLQITRQLFKVSGSAAYDPVRAYYRQVERAYRHAQRCLNALGRLARKSTR